MRRIERLINLIAALLETARPMTIHDIRDQIAGYDQENFDAFRRAFERDKEALRAMGIPLEVRSTDPFDEQADGYVIPKGRYYLPDIDFEPEEVAALRLASQAIVGAGEEAEAGLMKLSLDEGPGVWTGPGVVWGADVAAQQPLLGPLYAALLERRAVRFAYRTGGTAPPEPRVVEPYALVHRRGHWYLAGRDATKDAERSYKLTRIEGRVETLATTYELPRSFDPDARFPDEDWEIGSEDPESVRVRFDESLRWWVEQNLPAAADQDAGALEVELPVANLDALISWIVQFGEHAEIVSPPEARARLLEHLQPWLETERA